ncbi:MAG: NAD-dependent epimerase/dehydratase family protein [Nanoarchaeota archaeon]
MSKILITGSCGFIGTNCTIEAIERGYTVIGFDNLRRSLTEENLLFLQKTFRDKFIFIHGDIRNKVDFDRIPKDLIGIIALAGQCGIPYAQISPQYDFEVNALGTLNVLEYARLHGKIPVAFASSNKVYTNITNVMSIEEAETRYRWDNSGTPLWKAGRFEDGITIDRTGDVRTTCPISINEKLPLDADGKYARSLYGTSKVSADLYCQEYYQAFEVPTVVNRMSCIYGYYQKGVEDQAWVSWFIRQIKDGNRKINIFGTGKQVRDMLFGTDCAKLYLDEILNIDKVKGQAYNIGGGVENTMSLLEAIKFIEDETKNKAELTFLPKRHGDQDIWISDITKITTDLPMWKPTISPKEGIRLMITSNL